MRSVVNLVLVLTVCAGVAACNGSRQAQVDLILDPGEHRDETFLQWSVPVSIDGDTRIALSASRPQVVDHEMTDTVVETQKMLGGTVPESFKGVPTVILGPANVVDGVPTAIRVWPIIGGQIGKPFRFPVELGRVTPGGKPSVVVWPVPALENRDLVTQPVKVPSRTVLRVSAGLEAPCWPVVLLPVAMTVSAIDEGGNVVEIGTTSLNAFKPEARRWVALSFPLDAVAGKQVRFRFASRMNGPSQLQYALPVFADPTIENAGS